MQEYMVVTGSIRNRSSGFMGLGGSKSGAIAFQEDVATKLAEGWRCQGGVSFAFTPQKENDAYFVQALVRESAD